MSVNLEQKRRPWTSEEKEVLKSLFIEHSLHSKRSSLPYFRQDENGYNPAQKANEIEKEMDNILDNLRTKFNTIKSRLNLGSQQLNILAQAIISLKNQRIGLLYAASVSIIYSYKRFISQSWNQNELEVIKKTKEISGELLKQVKKDIKNRDIYIDDNDEDKKEEKKEKRIDGISYIDKFIPKIINIRNISPVPQFQDEFKTISKE